MYSAPLVPLAVSRSEVRTRVCLLLQGASAFHPGGAWSPGAPFPVSLGVWGPGCLETGHTFTFRGSRWSGRARLGARGKGPGQARCGREGEPTARGLCEAKGMGCRRVRAGTGARKERMAIRFSDRSYLTSHRRRKWKSSEVVVWVQREAQSSCEPGRSPRLGAPRRPRSRSPPRRCRGTFHLFLRAKVDLPSPESHGIICPFLLSRWLGSAGAVAHLSTFLSYTKAIFPQD